MDEHFVINVANMSYYIHYYANKQSPLGVCVIIIIIIIIIIILARLRVYAIPYASTCLSPRSVLTTT